MARMPNPALQKTGLALPAALADLDRLKPYTVAFRYDDIEITPVTQGEAAAIVDAALHSAAAAIPSEPTP